MRLFVLRAVTLVIGLTLLGEPVATDWCVANCAAARQASTSDIAPPCHHHTDPTGRNITPASRPCDHAAGVIAVASADPSRDRVAFPIVVVAPGAAAPAVVRSASASKSGPEIRPPLTSVPLLLSTTLRV